MGRIDVGLKCIQLRSLIEKREYQEAYKVAEKINLDKVTSIVDLKVIASVYERLGKYEEAKDILLRSYEKKPTKMVIYRLAYLCVKTNEFEDAEFFYQEFSNMAPNSPDRYILRYGIDRAKGVDYLLRIATLQKLKQLDYMEEWGYELAKVYHKAGLYEECIQECNDLITWFGDGIIVEKAQMLRQFHEEGRESLDPYGVFDEGLSKEELEARREQFIADTQDLRSQAMMLAQQQKQQEVYRQLDRDLEKTVDLRQVLQEEGEDLDLLKQAVHRSWGQSSSNEYETINVKKVYADQESDQYSYDRNQYETQGNMHEFVPPQTPEEVIAASLAQVLTEEELGQDDWNGYAQEEQFMDGSFDGMEGYVQQGYMPQENEQPVYSKDGFSSMFEQEDPEYSEEYLTEEMSGGFPEGYVNGEMGEFSEEYMPEEQMQQFSEGYMAEEQMQQFSEGYMPEEQMQQFSEGYMPEEQMQQFPEGYMPEEQMQQFSEGYMPEEQMQQFSEGYMPEEQMQQFSEGYIPEEQLQQFSDDSVTEEALGEFPQEEMSQEFSGEGMNEVADGISQEGLEDSAAEEISQENTTDESSEESMLEEESQKVVEEATLEEASKEVLPQGASLEAESEGLQENSSQKETNNSETENILEQSDISTTNETKESDIELFADETEIPAYVHRTGNERKLSRKEKKKNKKAAKKKQQEEQKVNKKPVQKKQQTEQKVSEKAVQEKQQTEQKVSEKAVQEKQQTKQKVNEKVAQEKQQTEQKVNEKAVQEKQQTEQKVSEKAAQKEQQTKQKDSKKAEQKEQQIKQKVNKKAVQKKQQVEQKENKKPEKKKRRGFLFKWGRKKEKEVVPTMDVETIGKELDHLIEEVNQREQAEIEEFNTLPPEALQEREPVKKKVFTEEYSDVDPESMVGIGDSVGEPYIAKPKKEDTNEQQAMPEAAMEAGEYAEMAEAAREYVGEPYIAGMAASSEYVGEPYVAETAEVVGEYVGEPYIAKRNDATESEQTNENKAEVFDNNMSEAEQQEVAVSEEQLVEALLQEEVSQDSFMYISGVDLWEYFSAYQNDKRLCEDIQMALEGIKSGRSMHMIITCKDQNRASQMGRDMVKALRVLGFAEGYRVAPVTAEKLNRMHLEKNYDQLEHGVLLVEGAKKMTADTAQSIMNMINEMGNRIVVILTDARPYMDDLMNEYKMMRRYFPNDLKMK